MAKTRKILIAMDGSPDSFNAMRYVGQTCSPETLEVSLMHIMSTVPKTLRDLDKEDFFREQMRYKYDQWKRKREKAVYAFLVDATDLLVKAKIDEDILFAGDRSNDADGEIVSYLWDFGDGSLPIWTNDTVIQHSYSEAGTFHVTLQVKDDYGGVSNATSVSVKVSGKESEESNLGDLLLLIAIIAVIIIIVAVIVAIMWIRSREAI